MAERYAVLLQATTVSKRGIGSPSVAWIKIGRRASTLRGLIKATRGIAAVPVTYEGKCRIQAIGGASILITPLDD